MIDQTAYIGARPFEADTKQRRAERRTAAGASFVGALIVAFVIGTPIVWHLALVLPGLLYLAALPRCWGDCRQGRLPCTSPDLCAGANAALADASAACRRQLRQEPELIGARMGMACAEATTSPAELGHYWPWGEHSRPGRLTEADFEAADRRRAPLRITPAIEHYRPKRGPSRLRLALRRAWRAAVVFLTAPRFEP